MFDNFSERRRLELMINSKHCIVQCNLNIVVLGRDSDLIDAVELGRGRPRPLCRQVI